MDTKKSLTSDFLNLCKEYKITRVAIGCRDSVLKSCKTFTFTYVDDCIFTNQIRDKKTDNPAIWEVMRKLEPHIHMVCGNGFQAQIKGMENLNTGIYQFKNKRFIKIK